MRNDAVVARLSEPGVVCITACFQTPGSENRDTRLTGLRGVLHYSVHPQGCLPDLRGGSSIG
jgi:hypothetical protein